MRWRCGVGHVWPACLDQILHGDWCRMCHFESIKPPQAEIERAAAERGGRCLSAYVDKETPLEWHCAEGHISTAEWFRVKRCRVSSGGSLNRFHWKRHRDGFVSTVRP